MVSAATYYVDSSIGDDSLPGTEAQPFETIEYAVSQMGALGDTLVIRYAGGTPYPIAAQINIDASVSGPTFVAEDSGGVRWDVSPTTYTRAQLPVIDSPNGTDCFVQTDVALLSFYGLDFDGSASSEGYRAASSGADVWIEGCRFKNFTDRAIRMRKGTVRETWIEGCGEGISCANDGAIAIESTVLYNNTGLAIDNAASSDVSLRNLTLLNNGGTTYPVAIPADLTLIENVLCVDSSTNYAWPDGIQTTGNAYTSDPSSYHTSGNYNGGSPDPTDDRELRPSFLDEASQDFHLRNDFLATGGTPNSVPRLWDGTTMPASPPIGALGLVGILISSGVVDSGTQITVTFDSILDPETVESQGDWTVVPVGAGVAVAVLSAVWVPASRIVVLTVYPTLSAGVDYTVTSLNADFVMLTNEAGTPLTNEHLITLRQG